MNTKTLLTIIRSAEAQAPQYWEEFFPGTKPPEKVDTESELHYKIRVGRVVVDAALTTLAQRIDHEKEN